MVLPLIVMVLVCILGINTNIGFLHLFNDALGSYVLLRDLGVSEGFLSKGTATMHDPLAVSSN